MKSSSLQIKLLSKTGEVLSVVNAFAAQVTVLRAVSQLDLAPYRRALAGIPGSEKFSVTINGESFDPNSANLIGFGEHFSEENQRVSEFLITHGVPDQTIEALVVSYGLERAIDLRCTQISPCEERRVRLLVASYQTKKPLILHEPFEPIASQWREKFAALITTFARNANQIVVVTGTSFRPESWIDNEYIARLQVGETIQKTIGFTSDAMKSDPLVSQLRERLKADEEEKQENKAIPVAVQNSKLVETIDKITKNPIAMGSLGILIVALVSMLALKSTQGIRAVEHGAIQTTPLSETPPVASTPVFATPNIPATIAPETALPHQNVRSLDIYPAEIKLAVLAAFEGGAGELPSSSKIEKAETPNTNLFKLLESISPNGPSEPKAGNEATLPDSIDEQSDSVESEEGRREEIRQRFLNAIKESEHS